MENEQAVTTIRNIIESRVEAIRGKDVDAATRHYAPDVVLFDVVGPLQTKDPGAVKSRLIEWFATFRDNDTVDFEIEALDIKASSTIAFSHSFNHINTILKDGNTLNMWWRETQHWQNINGEWLVTHTHSSVPFDAKSGKPSLALKPDQDAVTF